MSSHPYLNISGVAISAHRGGSIEAPENTLESFKYALDLGCSYIETDVQLSADGIPYIFHDDDLKRLLDRDVMFNTLSSSEIKKLRDKSIILIGFGGGFRRTELISIDHEDLEFVPEGLKITIRRSKTDQFGEGMIKGLPYFTNEIYCPVTNLKKWLEISKISTGPIFRRFSKGSSLTDKRLTDQSVVLLMKEYLNLAGIENKNFAGHSLRSGFATVAADSGADERSIMAMTGHKTTQMVRRYIREANIFKNNALNKIKI